MENMVSILKQSNWLINANSAKSNVKAYTGKVPEVPDVNTLEKYLTEVDKMFKAIRICSSCGVNHITLRIKSHPQNGITYDVSVFKELFTSLGYYVYARKYRVGKEDEFYQVRINWGN